MVRGDGPWGGLVIGVVVVDDVVASTPWARLARGLRLWLLLEATSAAVARLLRRWEAAAWRTAGAVAAARPRIAAPAGTREAAARRRAGRSPPRRDASCRPDARSRRRRRQRGAGDGPRPRSREWRGPSGRARSSARCSAPRPRRSRTPRKRSHADGRSHDRSGLWRPRPSRRRRKLRPAHRVSRRSSGFQRIPCSKSLRLLARTRPATAGFPSPTLRRDSTGL